MFFMQLQFALKSLLPRSAQIGLRKAIARRKRGMVGDVWPIHAPAGLQPPGWKGWPDGRSFAVVLTHDVETSRGVNRCRMVMDLEERLGFRSAFYFVPERYPVPPDLRDEMVHRGFEVGVHGLRHDVSLFRSEKEFKRQAIEINRYVKKWNAGGFRCPYMIQNLEWMRDYLEIEYDTSTFDTDPFEPQSDGVGTIFPFRLGHGGNHRPGYVELPCTLPQDLNLFVLLGESGIDVWKRKLDWIGSCGGMALLDTHPDYMQDRSERAIDEYPLRLYEEFLEYVRVHFAGRYWQVLPREMASYVRQHAQWMPKRGRQGGGLPDIGGARKQPSPATSSEVQRRPLRVCLVGALFYESDNRTLRYAEALQQRGDSVEVLALRSPGQSHRGVVNGVNVTRIQKRIRNEKGIFSYGWKLFSFLFRSFWILSKRHLQRPYDVIHVHSIPDFEVFAALVPKLLGAKVVLDIYDVLPEFYLSKFRATVRSPVYRLLLWQERLSARFAHHVISANHIWQKKLTARAVPESRCTPFINYIDTRLFCQRTRQRQDSRCRVIYPGVLNWHQGVDICVRAFQIFLEKVPDSEFYIYGEGSEKTALTQLITHLGLTASVFFKKPIPLSEIPQLLADSDIGLVGKRADVFGNEAYSTKILEYMSQGIPAIVPRTAIDAFYFNDSVVAFYDPGNPQDMAAQMLRVYGDAELRSTLVRNGLDYVKTNSWDSVFRNYLALIDRLVGR